MARQAVTDLEVDAVAADVLNHNDLSEGGMNPGLKVLVGFPAESVSVSQVLDINL